MIADKLENSTIEYLGLWEKINNPDFKGVEFDAFRQQAGSNSFTLSPSKWVETTGAIGIKSAVGRNGGTFAHRDIAFEFASWVSDELKKILNHRTADAYRCMQRKFQ